MVKIFEAIQNYTELLLRRGQFVHNGERTKVVGAINYYYKINDIICECYNSVIYKMLFIEELKPNLNLQSKSFLVCNTFIYVTDTISSGK